MDRATRELKNIVMNYGATQRAANVGTGGFDKHAANISDDDFFSERSNGRLIKSDLSYRPGQPLLKPLPTRK